MITVKWKINQKEETNENGENNMDVEDNETPEVEDEKPTEQEEEEDDDDDDEEEFAGFEDDENNQEDANTSERVSNNDKDDKLAESNDELNAVSFANLDLPLPDDNEINLPNWQEGDLGSSISAYTLYGLSQLDFKTNTNSKRNYSNCITGKRCHW